MSNFYPKSEVQRNAFDALVSLVKKFVPPNTFEGELYEAVDFVITAARRCIAGGETELVTNKALLEDYFGTLLKRDFAEFIELTRKLTDYVSELHGPNALAMGGGGSAQQQKGAAPVFVQDSSSSSDDDDSSSSSDSSDDEESSNSDSNGEGTSAGKNHGRRANKKRRTEAGAETSYPSTKTADMTSPDDESVTSRGVKKSNTSPNKQASFHSRHASSLAFPSGFRE